MKSKTVIRIRQDKVITARDEDYENPKLSARNDEELDALIEAVKKEYENLPQYTAFGDNNWETRDTIIEILEWAKGE